ncbi:MAG: SPOR domain-containing protein [Sphingomonadales bacterium]|nr:SPOR domain-containing protein [Sphingomonadales bacterium]NCQ22175.1 SPOR domain-containing protein [Sphingomonadales bacterium]NCT03342.1 SPOR domain-containing protein [Sphingomonadales bacterium]
MDRSIKTGSRSAPRLALAITTAIAGLTLAGMAANAAPRADEYFSKAQTALQKGQVAKAIDHAEAAVLADPRNPSYRALLGAAYLEAGRFNSAATSFGDALDLGDENPRTVLSYALAKIALGEPRVAAATLDDYAQAIDPTDLGLALALAGQPERGMHVLVNAVRSAETTTPKLRQNLAYTYALAGNWRAARVMAAEDVPADQLDARMSQWAAMAAAEQYQQRIASLLDVSPRADSGQPVQLALVNNPDQDTQMAAAEMPMPSQAALAMAEPVAPALTPAPASAAAAAQPATVAQAFAAAEQPVRTAALPSSGVRYVSNPVVQELPARAAPAATRVAAASPQRRMAPAAAPASASAPAMGDKAAGSHLVQLGSYDSKIEAQRGWKVLSAKFPQLKGHAPVISEAVVNGRTFWRVAAAGFGPKSARSMCGTVKSAGRGCFAYAATTPPTGAVKRDIQVASRSR